MAGPALVAAERRPDEQALLLRWEDGHAATFPWRLLRGFCPCAACQGHHAEAVVFHPAGAPLLSRVEPVGAYAISLAFADGHGSGIYSYDLLRRLCPCPECSARSGAPESRRL